MKAMQAEGHDNFYKYLQGFGLTQPSGIDVGGETCLLPAAADKLADSQYATAAFGQGIDTNMVQMLAAINLIANGGKKSPPPPLEALRPTHNPPLLPPPPPALTPPTT